MICQILSTLNGHPALAGRVLWSSVCLSFRLSRRFLRMVSLVFSKFWHGARNPREVVHDRAGFSRKKSFCPKNWKMRQKWAKNRFSLNILKNFVINFYWICSIMKIYIICCVPAQIPYLGKFLFLRYGPKCSQPIRLRDFLISHISRMNQWNILIFWMLIQIHIKVDQIIFGWAWPVSPRDSKTGCIARMNWWNELIFACWCEFRKARSYFNGFWVCWVKNGCGHLVYETLKSAEWVYG